MCVTVLRLCETTYVMCLRSGLLTITLTISFTRNTVTAVHTVPLSENIEVEMVMITRLATAIYAFMGTGARWVRTR